MRYIISKKKEDGNLQYLYGAISKSGQNYIFRNIQLERGSYIIYTDAVVSQSIICVQGLHELSLSEYTCQEEINDFLQKIIKSYALIHGVKLDYRERYLARAFKVVQSHPAGFQFIAYFNRDKKVKITEKYFFTKIEHYTLVWPNKNLQNDQNNLIIRLQPETEDIIVFKQSLKAEAEQHKPQLKYTLSVTADTQDSKLYKEIQAKGKCTQRVIEGKEYDIFQWILELSDGFAFYYQNRSDKNYEEELAFHEPVMIKGAKTKSFHFKLQPADQIYFIVVKSGESKDLKYSVTSFIS